MGEIDFFVGLEYIHFVGEVVFLVFWNRSILWVNLIIWGGQEKIHFVCEYDFFVGLE